MHTPLYVYLALAAWCSLAYATPAATVSVNTNWGEIQADGAANKKQVDTQCVQMTTVLSAPPVAQAVGIKAECEEPIFLFVGNSTDSEPGPGSNWVVDHAFQAQMLTITKKSVPAYEAGTYNIRLCTTGPPLGVVHIAITQEAGNGIIPGGHGILNAASTNRGDRINVRWVPANSADFPDKEPQPFRYCIYAIAKPIQSKSTSFFYDLSTWRQIEQNGGEPKICVDDQSEASFPADPFTGYYVNIIVSRKPTGNSLGNIKAAYGVTHVMTVDMGALATLAGALAVVVFLPCLICACCVCIFLALLYALNSQGGQNARRHMPVPSVFNRAQGYTEVNMRQIEPDDV